MLNPDNIHQKLVELGLAWADDNAAADLLEETKKTLISHLAADLEGSQTAKESYAIRHPEYREHIISMVDARHKANRSKVRYDSAKVWADLMRTKAATERAAMGTAT